MNELIEREIELREEAVRAVAGLVPGGESARALDRARELQARGVPVRFVQVGVRVEVRAAA